MDTDVARPPEDSPPAAAVERRTQILGRRLLERLQRRRTSWADGVEGRVLQLLSENDRLRTRALRLVDVLPGLTPGRDDALLLDLARELLGPLVGPEAREEHGGRDLPAAVALPLQAALSGAVPAGAFAGLARGAVSRIGRRFIVPAGEEGRVLHDLRAAGRLATFDVLGEAVVGERQAAAYAARYRDLVAALARDADAGRDSPGGVRRLQVSLKLSALTPRFDPADPRGTLRRIREPLEAILDGARRAGVAVTWDLEQYALRDLTWWLFQEVFRPGGPFGEWDGAGIVAQAYLRDAPAFVGEAVAFARRRGVPFQVRLVKGAYWDYETVVAGANRWPAPVFAQKWQTDARYEALTRTLLGAWPAPGPAPRRRRRWSTRPSTAWTRPSPGPCRTWAGSPGTTCRAATSWAGWPTWCAGCWRTPRRWASCARAGSTRTRRPCSPPRRRRRRSLRRGLRPPARASSRPRRCASSSPRSGSASRRCWPGRAASGAGRCRCASGARA